MGWKTFATEPPDRELITVYIAEDEKFWLADARWSRADKAIIWADVYLSGTMCVVLWRERHPEPRPKMIRDAVAVRCINDPGGALPKWIDRTVAAVHESVGKV